MAITGKVKTMFEDKEHTQAIFPRTHASAIAELNSHVVNLIYPVGSIYMSLNQYSPATLFGVGTWELIKDRFILGAGDIYGLGSTGGEASHILTREELPRETMMFANREANQWTTGEWQASVNAKWKAEPNSTTGYFETNGDQPHNNMPPYLAVHIWKRIA